MKEKQKCIKVHSQTKFWMQVILVLLVSSLLYSICIWKIRERDSRIEELNSGIRDRDSHIKELNLKIDPNKLLTKDLIKHTTIEGYNDTYGSKCTYIGDTIDGKPHGYGKMIYKDCIDEGTYMNGIKHGSIKRLYNDDNKEGRILADIQCMYGKLHGYQIARYKDHTVYHVYNNGKEIYVRKQVYNDRTTYINRDDSKKDFYRLTYYNDGSEIVVWKKKGDIIQYKRVK